MKIIAVYECEVSGGTDRLLIHLIKNWPDKQAAWTVLCYESNSGIELLQNELKDYAQILIYSAGIWKDKFYNYLKSKKFIFSLIIKFINWGLFPMSFLHQFFYFRKNFKQNKPDLVYLHQGGYPGGFSEHAAGLAIKTVDQTVKVVITIQNLPAMRDKKLFSRCIDKITNSYAHALIFATNYTKEEFVKKTRLRQSIMHIVNEGVSANPMAKKITSNDSIVNIGIIGAYEKRKGHRVFFDALRLLKKDKVPNFRVHCYGQSKYGEFLQINEYTKKQGIYDLIKWHEYESDFDKLYGHLDIVVQSSIDKESMPLVPIDAAAYYKPVIASKLQGLNEIVEHGLTGYLFDIGDSDRLAGYLKQLIKDAQKREKFGLAARRRFEARFTAAKMSKGYYKIFVNEL